MRQVIVYTDPVLADYHFGKDHPFGPARFDAFITEFTRQNLASRVLPGHASMASDDDILLFHEKGYQIKVKGQSETGVGFLDGGDTPAFRGVYEVAARVVGTTLDAVDRVMTRQTDQAQSAFIPIAGLHHARRDRAAGFCVFNDCGVAIEQLRKKYRLQRIAYVDIDAHHGDGVFYSFESDPDLCFVDVHEDGRFLYPGTGAIEETGLGNASGSKLNIPMPMAANDAMFKKVWLQVEPFIRKARPEFILFQCGADSLQGDPITHMAYSEATHRYATLQLCKLADELCEGRLLAMGGGGYNLDNIACAWNAVVTAMLES